MAALAIHLSKIALKLSGYKLYAAGSVRPDPRWHMAPHSHSFHEIIVVIQGRLLLDGEGERIVARAGDILFYRAGFVHEETSDPKHPVGTYFIDFANSDLLSWMSLLTHDVDGRIRQLIKWIVEDECNHRAPETRRPLLEALFGELRRLCDVPSSPWLEGILDYMRENLTRPIRLDELARRGHMSKFAFVRKFKQLRGRTPMEDLRLTRLDQARNLLLTTDLPVKAIAPAVGIGDEYQLCKLFRSHFDFSPRELRIRSRKATAR